MISSSLNAALISVFAAASASGLKTSLSQTLPIGGMNVSTGNPSRCPHATSYFHQYIDHSLNVTSNNTFLQQYQIIDDYWKPGGPILFYQGAENPEILCLEHLSLPEFAQELGALVVGIEHRYFGVSTPFGLNSSESLQWNLAQWGALTLDNVLADSAKLVKWIKGTTKGAEESKGHFFRRYPEIFHGAIVTGGVNNGLDTKPNSPAASGPGNWLSNVIADVSYEAASIIRVGMDEIGDLMAAGNFSTLASSLILCTPPNSTTQTPMLKSEIVSAYLQNVQTAFSIPVLDPESKSEYLIPPHQLQVLINRTLAASSPLAAINASVAMLLARETLSAPVSCLDWTTDDNRFATRQLTYIVCNYLTYPFAFSTSASSAFGETGDYDAPTGNNNEAICQQAFGIHAEDGNLGYQQELGLSQQQMEREERIFAVEAQYDPVASLGLQSWVASSDRMKGRWWFMAEASHTEDILRSSKYDTQPLKDTRAAQLSYMRTWLEQ